MSQSELACVYASLILHDDGVEISVFSSPANAALLALSQAQLPALVTQPKSLC